MTALLLSGALAASVLTGCGGLNKDATVATLDGEEISLGVANFAARLQQVTYDDFYVSYFGDDVWSSSVGDGTMEDMTKSSVMDSVEELYILQKHADEYDVALSEDEKAAITAAAEDFIAANSDAALEAMGADQDIVEEYLSLLTIQSKMRAAIIVDADTDVSDEEANVSTFSYVRISKSTYTDADGNSAAYTEEEQEQLAKTVGIFVAQAKAGDLDEVSEEYGYTVYTATFTADDSSLDESLYEGVKDLEEGEVSDVIDTDDYYYVARLDAKTDADATEQNRQSIISQRQSDLYDEVLEGWKEESEWIVKDKVWAKVSFDNLFTTVQESTETVEDTTEQ